MTAENFRHLFGYHQLQNRMLWDQCIVPLSEAQFTQTLDYSVGSMRNQVVHMFNIDERWLFGLRGEEPPGFENPVDWSTREQIRAKWDEVEAGWDDYLGGLSDVDREFMPGVQVWQVLFHVLNHGTDHRAQVLAMLHGLGAETLPQDYIYFAMGRYT